MVEISSITIQIAPDGAVKRFSGRFAWALSELIRAGAPVDRPTPRLSHYIYRLRREGVPIKTVPEKHGGEYAGPHGRYVIAPAVTVVVDSLVKGKGA